MAPVTNADVSYVPPCGSTPVAVANRAPSVWLGRWEWHVNHFLSPSRVPPLSSVSPMEDNRKSIDFSDVVATTATGGVHGEQNQPAFAARFKEVMESELVEVREGAERTIALRACGS